jgi:CRP/FNR family transcriptional regulator
MEYIHSVSGCKNCPYKNLIFGALRSKEFDFLEESRKEVLFRKGDIITKEGAEIKEFLYLKSGLLKVYKTGADNKTQIIRIAGAADFISLLSMFSNDRYKYSIAAIEDTTVCIVDSEKIKTLARENGEFALELMKRMSYTYDEIIDTTYRIRQKHLRGRIAYILLYFAQKIYRQNRFELPVSRREIAELINMTTENVIRILSEFKKDGIIGIDGKMIDILDVERLEQIKKIG